MLGVALALSGIVFVIKPLERSLHPMKVIGDLLFLGSQFTVYYGRQGKQPDRGLKFYKYGDRTDQIGFSSV